MKNKNLLVSIRKLIETKKLPYYVITLGIGECYAEDMKSCIELMNNAWRYLTSNRKSLILRKSAGIIKKLCIGLDNEKKLFYPHFCLLFIPNDNNYESFNIEIQRAWTIALGLADESKLTKTPIKVYYHTTLNNILSLLEHNTLFFDINNLETYEKEIIISSIKYVRKYSRTGIFKKCKLENQ